MTHRLPASLPLVALISIGFGLETSAYSVIAPLIPYYTRVFHISGVGIGVVTAAYTASLLLGAAVSAAVTHYLGDKRALIVAFVLFALAALAITVVGSTATLIAIRALQGTAGGAIWGAGFAWLTAATPPAERGYAIGTAFAGASVGTIAGPALGGLATAFTPAVVFVLLACLAVTLAALSTAVAPPQLRPADPVGAFAAAPPRALVGTVVFVTCQSVPFGVITALFPIHLSRLGASSLAISLTYVAASAAAAVLSPFSGRMSDRRGRMFPLQIGLPVASITCLALPLPLPVFVIAPIAVVCIGTIASLCLSPAVTVLSDAADRAGRARSFPLLMLATVAVGESLGSTAAASVSELTSPVLPYALLSAIELVALGSCHRRRRLAEGTGGQATPIAEERPCQ